MSDFDVLERACWKRVAVMLARRSREALDQGDYFHARLWQDCAADAFKEAGGEPPPFEACVESTPRPIQGAGGASVKVEPAL